MKNHNKAFVFPFMVFPTKSHRFLSFFVSFLTEAVYDATLQSVKQSFPQYVRELEGVAHGAGVDFHKVWKL